MKKFKARHDKENGRAHLLSGVKTAEIVTVFQGVQPYFALHFVAYAVLVRKSQGNQPLGNVQIFCDFGHAQFFHSDASPDFLPNLKVQGFLLPENRIR